MKRLLTLTICFGLMAIGLQAAPPLRVLMPMKTANGTIAAPLAKAVSPFYGDTPCPSQSLIGEGSYLQHSGSPRVLTILAAYQDLDFTVNNPVQAFEQYLNGDVQEDLGNHNQLNIASVRQYFEICSHGQFSPQFDVVGPVTLPQKMAFYGGKKSDGSDDKFTEFHYFMQKGTDFINNIES